MDLNVFEYIKAELQNYYEKDITGKISHSKLALLRKSYFIARYVMLVIDYDCDISADDNILKSRRLISRNLFAVWAIANIGMTIVFLVPELKWDGLKSGVSADKTGLHNVIVQGIIFLDIDNNSSLVVDCSSWGNYEFGDTYKIAKVIESYNNG